MRFIWWFSKIMFLMIYWPQIVMDLINIICMLLYISWWISKINQNIKTEYLYQNYIANHSTLSISSYHQYELLFSCIYFWTHRICVHCFGHPDLAWQMYIQNHLMMAWYLVFSKYFILYVAERAIKTNWISKQYFPIETMLVLWKDKNQI